MKRFKKIIILITVVGVIGIASAAFAAAQSPAETVPSLTGETVEDADKLEEFKEEMLAKKKAILDQRVADGELTQEEADEIYNRMKDNMANCDGSRNGQKSGSCSGQGKGKGKGQGGRNRNNGGMGRGPCNNG